MGFEGESQLSVRCFKCGCFGHRGHQCENLSANRRSQSSGAVGMLDKCWICGCLGHIAVECKENTVTCFSCGEKGHKQEDCTSPMANCWNCGKKGHIKKDCPVKKNVGMCFYCHEVGHHSKDCDQKVCYICQSKEHLWTRCPFRGIQGGFQPRTNGYNMRHMRHLPRGQDQAQAFQTRQFSNQLLLENQYYKSFEQQDQIPRCIRPKSAPLTSPHGTLSIMQQRNPMAMRWNSEPVTGGYNGNIPPYSRMNSLDDFNLVHSRSSFSSLSPQFGFGGQRSSDGSGFDMADIPYRSDESLMKVTESERDSSPVVPSLDGRRKSLIQADSFVWKEISRESDPGVPTWGNSSDMWRAWDNELREESKKDEVASAINVDAEGKEHSQQDQQTDQPAQATGSRTSREVLNCEDKNGFEEKEDTKTESPDGEVVASNTDVGHASNVINTGNPSSPISSKSTKESSTTSESTLCSGIEEQVEPQNIEGVTPKPADITSKPAETRKTESQINKQVWDENNVQEELKRLREQLAEAKKKLVAKDEELYISQKTVQHLKNVICLESTLNKRFSKKKDGDSTRGEDVRNRCANCIQILKNMESCEECVM